MPAMAATPTVTPFPPVVASTSVHPKETTCNYSSYHALRHRMDHPERESVLSALLQDPDHYSERAARLRACGDNAWLYRHKTTGHVRLASSYCHDRFCPACQRSHRHTVSSTLRDVVSAAQRQTPARGLTLLSLTLRSSTSPLKSQCRRLRHAFGLLRRRSFFASRSSGGVVALEITFNSDELTWHPHLHVLMIADYIRHEDLKRHWQRITGDSYVLDIQRVRTPAKGVRYISKYISKPMNLTALPAWFILELVASFKGVRLYSLFGTLRNAELPERAEREPFNPDDWEPLGSVVDHIHRANQGDIAAYAILAHLGFYGPDADPDPQHELEFT